MKRLQGRAVVEQSLVPSGVTQIMIDFDHFWHERGCAPGLTREETEAQFRQMAQWLQELPGATVHGEAEITQQPGLFPGPGVTTEQISAWERDRGVRLPEVFRQALARQDGGYLRNMPFRILPLAEIATPDDEFWEYACYQEDEVTDRGRVLRFAWNEELGGSYFLNYAKGSADDPSVYVHHNDPGDLDQCSGTVTTFFSRLLETAELPSVDWSETDGLEVIARETIDLSPMHNAPAEFEQILGRQGENLVLYTRDRSPEGETLTRTTLPGPLDRDGAQIQRHRPDPIGTYGLMIQPEDSAGIVEHESKRTPDGKWKNYVSNGAPVYVMFESTDRNRLGELRKTLLGGKAAAMAKSRDRSMEDLQQKMQSLSPEQVQAAGMAMFMELRTRLNAEHPMDPASMPPEAAAIHEALQQRMRAVEQRARDALGGQSLNPEIQQLLRKATGLEDVNNPPGV